MIRHNITPDLVETLLNHIPANCSRDDWARVLAAIKSEFDNETGFTLADQWSATAAENYNAESTRDTWKSVKASGGVTIGTLFFMAKQNGFTLPKPDQPVTQPDPAITARLAAERAERDRLQNELTASRHAAASDEALAQWDAASDTGQSGYLDRKGVQGHGVRFAPDGVLLVPLRDAAGRLWNVQRIAPTNPQTVAPTNFF
jgi:putative DNA primase/helicase